MGLTSNSLPVKAMGPGVGYIIMDPDLDHEGRDVGMAGRKHPLQEMALNSQVGLQDIMVRAEVSGTVPERHS